MPNALEEGVWSTRTESGRDSDTLRDMAVGLPIDQMGVPVRVSGERMEPQQLSSSLIARDNMGTGSGGRGALLQWMSVVVVGGCSHSDSGKMSVPLLLFAPHGISESGAEGHFSTLLGGADPEPEPTLSLIHI